MQRTTGGSVPPSVLIQYPWLRRSIVAFLVMVVLLLHSGWFMVILGSPDPASAALRDWIQFHRTALRITSGNLGDVYPVAFAMGEGPEFTDGFFFLYPPFAGLVTLPLAAFSPWGAYLVCYVGVAAVTLVATLATLRMLGVRGSIQPIMFLWIMASAPWNVAVFLGHLSATLVISPVLALIGWIKSRPAWAGAALSILMAKPNLGLPLLVFLCLGRQWRMVRGVLYGAGILVAASLPMGWRLWRDWLLTMVNYWHIVTHGTPPWKQVTLYASIQSLLSRPGWDPYVQGLWVILSFLFLIGLGLVWIRFGKTRISFPRLLGVTLLTVLVTNSYVYFYDAILLMPAGIILWTKPDVYGSRGLRLGSMAVSLLTWGWMHIQFFLFPGRAPSLAGLGLAVWLGLELWDLTQMSPRIQDGEEEGQGSRGPETSLQKA